MDERDREPKTPAGEADAPGAPQPAIVWCDRPHARCAGCNESLHRTPGLVGRSGAGELQCSVCLGFESEPLAYGLRILEAIHDALNRWPGGPRKPEKIPEHWYSCSWALGPPPDLTRAKGRKK